MAPDAAAKLVLKLHYVPSFAQIYSYISGSRDCFGSILVVAERFGAESKDC